MSQAHFEIYLDKAKKYRWRLRAANGEIVASGQSYRRRSDCARGIDAVRHCAAEADIEYQDKCNIGPDDCMDSEE